MTQLTVIALGQIKKEKLSTNCVLSLFYLFGDLGLRKWKELLGFLQKRTSLGTEGVLYQMIIEDRPSKSWTVFKTVIKVRLFLFCVRGE